MSEVKDTELLSLLSHEAAKERRAFRRATLYMAVPVLIGLLLIGVSVYQLRELERSKAAVVKNVEALRIDNERLLTEQGELQKQIDELKSRRTTAQGELDEVLASLAETKELLREKERALADATRDLQEISEGKVDPIKQAQMTLRRVEAVSGGRFVVIGADRTLSTAQSRAQRVARLGYPRASIYLRQKSYRTVIEFPDEQTAAAKLPEIRARLNDNAYRRDISQWCPNAQQRNGYFQ
ncbi:MAG: hypothetical protein ICV68_05465, partial [Pyrinomonadaceae bacterium]|nr:hypothetical protein [Pyrinomonadaceae bacterium]